MANKKVVDQERLTSAQFAELAAVARNIFLFAKFIFLIHPLRGKVRFDLYPFQMSVLYNFIKNPYNIVLKFRQAGVTELISMYCLWFAMYHPNKNIVIISIKDRIAKKVLRKIKFMYKNLPTHLRTKVVNGKGDDIGTQTEIEFANGSIISSIPTTEDAGRSEAVSLLIIDEAAIVRWADRIWAASWPTLSTGGRAILNSCVTGDTEIIGRNGNIRIDTICPEQFGKKDISHLGLEVLSHTGTWRRVIGSVNKGTLETWEITNKWGDILKCTPNHKLLTPQGWKTVKEIVETKSRAIFYRSGLDDIKIPPTTVKPKKEVLKPVMGFDNYLVSNWGKLYICKNGKTTEKAVRPNNRGYKSVNLWKDCVSKKKLISHLVAEAFIGKIPEGYVVDHINCNYLDDYSTNLQIITVQENTKRAAKYSRGMKLGGKIGKGFPNLQLIGKIRDKWLNYGKSCGLDLIIDEVESEMGIKVTRAFVSRIVNKERTKTVKVSKLKVNRKYLDAIYDICVDQDESYITATNYVNHNTPYGVGNLFHKTFVDACSGGNAFVPIRLYWRMHPERDDEWYKMMRDILGPRKTAQEIDGDFLTSGNTVFDLTDIRDMEDFIDEEVTVEETYMNGLLKVYKKPVPGRKYTIGADLATGRANDFTAFTCLDDLTGEEMLSFKGKIPISKATKLLGTWGKTYNRARLAPESNDIGLGVAEGLQDNGYRNLYYSRSLLRKKGHSRAEEKEIPGWYTTKSNRHLIIASLEEDVRNNTIILKDKAFCHEAYTFIYDSRNRPVAMNKDKASGDEVMDDQVYTDDKIFSAAIGNFVRKQKQTVKSTTPR